MIDAHAHLSDPRLEARVDGLVKELQSMGLHHMVLGGVEPEEWKTQKRLKFRFPSFVTSVVGIHPWTVRDHDEAALQEMFSVLTQEVDSSEAIGEVGLDFFPKRLPNQVEKQMNWCKRQLELAKSCGKPVVLHVVRGHDLMQSLLKDMDLPMVMIHGFKGHHDVAKFYLDRGYLLSLGARSFVGASFEDYRWLPKNAFVLESDAPQLKGDCVDDKQVAENWIEGLNVASNFLAEMWSMSRSDVWSHAKANLSKMFSTL